MIQSYLDAQRGPRSTTRFILHRTGRTSAAVWAAGHRVTDARATSYTLGDDVHAKVMRAFVPDLNRLGRLNPWAAKYTEAKIHAVVDGALVILQAALNENTHTQLRLDDDD